MKFPLSPPRPRAADRSLLPAALCALLAAGLVTLIVLPADDVLPAGGVVAPLRLPRLDAAAPLTDPIIVQRTLFAPTRRPDGGGTAAGTVAAAAPLGGARIAGVTVAGGRARVFVVAPDGRLATLGPGGSYNGWRLSGVTTAAVRFTRAGESLVLAVGGVAARAGEPPQSDDDAEASPS